MSLIIGGHRQVNLGGDACVALASKAAFAGVSVDGSVLDVRQGLNSGYYGQAATPLDILVKRAVTNPDSTSLQAAVADAAK